MPDKPNALAGLLKDDPAAQVVLDRTIGKEGPDDKSGNPLLDAALSDPGASKAIKDAVTVMTVGGGVAGLGAGAAVGFGAGLTLMGIIWAVWPKKGR
jgi:hypothetical protein